jgi:hypothetical protein
MGQDKQIGLAPAAAAPTAAPPKAAAVGKHGQAERGDGVASVHQAAAHGTSGAPVPLPFRSQIQKAFGKHDISNVQAYTDAAAADGGKQMGAQAFTTGNHIAFARTPDLHLAAEEAAHVVQQRAGAKLPGGVGKPDDKFEDHALAVADAVVAGQNAEPILDTMAAPAAGTASDAKSDPQVQMRSDAGGRSSGRGDPFDALFGRHAHHAVNRSGAVQAELGVYLRKDVGGAKTATKIPFGGHATVLHETTEADPNARWAYVTTTHGSGFVERWTVTTDAPECTAKLYLIKGGDTLGGIAAKFYGKHFESGNDARLYVQALYLANKHRTGIKLNEADLSKWETATRGKSEEETLRIYKGVQVNEDQALWIPSSAFIEQLKKHGAVTSGQTAIKKAWDGAKDAVGDLWNDVKYVAGLTAGLIHGAANACYDLLKGAVELTGKVIQIAAALITGHLGKAVSTATGWVKDLAKLWKNRSKIKDAFVAKWTQDDPWARGNFQGETIGWILTSIALMVISGGSSSTGMVAVLATKFPTMVKAIQALGKLGDAMTWGKSAARTSKKIGGRAEGEIRKVVNAAKKAADAKKRKRAEARRRKRERERERERDAARDRKKDDDHDDNDGPSRADRAKKRWIAMIKRADHFHRISVDAAASYGDQVALVRATGTFGRTLAAHVSDQTLGVQLQAKDSNYCGMPKVELLPSGMAALRRAMRGKPNGPVAKQVFAFLHGKQDSVVVRGNGEGGGLNFELSHRDSMGNRPG